MTLRKCVETVDKIKATGDATIDISLYSIQELSIIRELLDEDKKGILEFFREVQNIDIEKLYLTIKYLDAMSEDGKICINQHVNITDELIRTLKKYRSLASVIEVVEFCQENIETVEELAEYLQGKEK